MSTGINIAPSSDLTVGTTAVTSGTDGRVFFQAGGVVQQDANFTFDNTLKRLTLKAVGTAATDIPLSIGNSAGTGLLFQATGDGKHSFNMSPNTNFALSIDQTNQNGGISVYSSGQTIFNVAKIAGSVGYMGVLNNGNYSFFTGNSSYFNHSLVVGGNSLSPGARLDVRAQGALSTDIAFRVRNSVDTLNIFDVNGLGEVNAKVGNQNLLYLNSTAGFSSAYTGQNFIVNTAVSGIGNNKNNMVLINASDSTGTGTAGVISINTASPVSTSVSIGSGVANSHRIQLGGFTSQMGFNLSCNTGSMVVGSNMSWVGGGSSSGMFVFGNNVGGGVVNGFANALVFGNGQVDFVIGGGKGNIGVNYNPTGRTETNTIFVNSGTAPTTSITDGFQQYSADITAGNAAPHFRTENGAIIKVYQETTAVAASTLVGGGGTTLTDTDTFDGYTLKQIVKALRNQGLLA